LTIREIIAEQRRRSGSANPAERLAAGLLIPKLLRDRLSELRDDQVGRLLEHEVCSNLSVLAPELTVSMEAVERLCNRQTVRFVLRRRSRALQNEGEHILHAEAALYRGRIPHLLLPFQRDRFVSNVFMVPSIAEARDCLCHAGFREASRSPSLLIDRETSRPIRVVEETH
jgi:hypothetical protein